MLGEDQTISTAIKSLVRWLCDISKFQNTFQNLIILITASLFSAFVANGNTPLTSSYKLGGQGSPGDGGTNGH